MAIEDYFVFGWSNAHAKTVGQKAWVFPAADVTVTPTAAFLALAPEAAGGGGGLVTLPSREGKALTIASRQLGDPIWQWSQKQGVELPLADARAWAAAAILAAAPAVKKACLGERGRAALGYAGRGWAVFPLHTPLMTGVGQGQQITCSCGHPDCPDTGKHPRTKHGLKDATTDENTIIEWWWESPDANIGSATGRRSGIAAIDEDPRHGGDVELARLEGAHGALPATPEQLTGGGGRHIVFAGLGVRAASSPLASN